MLFENDFKIRMRDVGDGNKISNAGIMSIMEETATLHSYNLGFAVNECMRDNLSWIILDWDIRIFSRAGYNESVKSYTWTRKYDKLTAYRDFKITDNEGNIIAIATSRWLLMDILRRRPCRLTEDITKRYECEAGKIAVADDIEKIILPQDIDFTDCNDKGNDKTCGKMSETNDNSKLLKAKYDIIKIPYRVLKRDIDFNGHVHNLVYLDMALEALPDNINNMEYSSIRIEYKKEIMPDSNVLCTYCRYGNSDIVVISTDNVINCIVQLS